MGFNTVVFLLNDLMHDLAKSPHTTTWALTHPLMSEHDRSRWQRDLQSVAKEHGEPMLHPQALEILPTFHADFTTYFRAGGNCIEKLNVVRYGKTKEGKNTITLELPEWWDKKRHL